MDQQALQKLKQVLSEAENLGIVVGPNPTVDEMGAALAFYISLKTANKKVSIVSPTHPEAGRMTTKYEIQAANKFYSVSRPKQD